MIAIKVENLNEISKDFDALERNVGKETHNTLGEVGRFVESEQKRRSPFSPTKAQAAGTGYHYDPKKSPGELQNSIEASLGRDYVDVGVLHGNATKYAAAMNYGEYKLGPGSRAKSTGRTVGRLFVERGYTENKRAVDKKFEVGMDKVVTKFNE